MNTELRNQVQQLIERERLPEEFHTFAAQFYLPLADVIADSRHNAGRPWMVGINGAQGTGKSTMAQFLQLFLEHKHHLRCASISLDDIYLTRAERTALAASVHPLLITRGVPGTHDLALGISVCKQLLGADDAAEIPIPRFDKATDDRLPAEQWTLHKGKTDVLLLEGWCIGSRPQALDALDAPINGLESAEDPQGVWRRYVNARLHDYQQWFAMIDQLIMLKAPSMNAIYRWRGEQEQKLAASARGNMLRIMSADQIRRFIQHYERVTTFGLTDIPPRADLVFHLDEAHAIAHVTGPLAKALPSYAAN